jgi:ACR3 family arsenite efflux pump ArsB
MWNLLVSLNKNLIWSIPAIMLLGIGFGVMADPIFLRDTLKSAIVPLTFLMVYPMMINLQVGKVLQGGDFRLQLTAQVINFAIIPFFAYGLGRLFFADRPLVLFGLLLTSLLPTSGMTISWTGFAKGNLNAAVKMTVIGLVLGSLAAPLYAKLLMGETVAIPLADIFKQIMTIVFLPMLLGIATRMAVIRVWGADRYQRSLKQKFPVFSTLGVLGIVFVAMALKATSIVSAPLELIGFFVPLMIIYAVNFGLSTIIGKLWFERDDAIALVYGTVMRNLSIALAIAITVFGPKEGSEIALIISMGYIIQVQAAAWYVKFTDRIFGEAVSQS